MVVTREGGRKQETRNRETYAAQSIDDWQDTEGEEHIIDFLMPTRTPKNFEFGNVTILPLLKIVGSASMGLTMGNVIATVIYR